MIKQKGHKAVCYIVVITMVVFWGAGALFAGDDETAIDSVRLAFNAAYNAGDARAMAALLDPDAVWMPPTGEKAIVGADRIAARYEAFFGKTSSTFELKAGTIELSGGYAYLSGEWQRSDTAGTGSAPTPHGGFYLMVFKKQPDGSWKIARDIWNDGIKP